MKYAIPLSYSGDYVNHTPQLFLDFEYRLNSVTNFEQPIFMMPVRLETRFMKGIERPIFFDVAVDGFAEVWYAAEATLTLIDSYTVFDLFDDIKLNDGVAEIFETIVLYHDKIALLNSLQLSDKEALININSRISAKLTIARDWMVSKSSGPAIESTVTGIFNNISSEISAINNDIQTITLNTSWEQHVSTEASQTASSINAVMQSTDANLGQMLINGGQQIDMQKFNLFVAQCLELRPIIKSYSSFEVGQEISAYNKLYLWTLLEPINTRINTLFGYIEQVKNTDANFALYKKELYSAASKLQYEWLLLNARYTYSFLTNVKNASRYTEEDFNVLNPIVAIAGSTINTKCSELEGFLAQILSSIRDVNAYNQLLETCDSINETLLALIQENSAIDELSVAYLWNSISKLNDVLGNLIEHLKNVERLHIAVEEEAVGIFNSMSAFLNSVVDPNMPTTEEINGFSNDVKDLYIYISDKVGEANTILVNLNGLQNESWDYQLFNDYKAQLFEIGQLMPSVSSLNESNGDVSLEQHYLWHALSPLIEQSTTLNIKIGSLKWEEGTLTLGSHIEEVLSVGIDIAGTWGDVIAVNGPIEWVANTQKQDELWIRVYPDDIEINNHDELLTLNEKDAGVSYWEEWYNAHGDPKLQLAAWKSLVDRFGEERSAWIIKALFPTNFSINSTTGVVTGTTTTTYYKAVTQLTTLTKYINLLSAATWTTNNIVAAQNHVTYIGTHIQSTHSNVMAVNSLPSEEHAVLEGVVNNFQAAYTGFESVVASTYSGDVSLGETTYLVSNIVSHVAVIDVVTNWTIVYNNPPVFPTVTLKPQGWNNTAYTSVMPDRFVFQLIQNEDFSSNIKRLKSTVKGDSRIKHLKVGNKVPTTLYTGISPQPDPSNPTADAFKRTVLDNLEVLDKRIKWVFDFNEAVNVGMATYIPLRNNESVTGFDKLLVYGLRLGEGVDLLPNGQTIQQYVLSENKYQLEKLLESHHYTGGLEILKIGTPTNNTSTNNAGYKEEDPFAEKSFATQATNPLLKTSTNKLFKPDGQWLADALGIEYNVFFHVKNADKKQTSNAIAMNRALWNGTIGSFMRDMMSPLFTNDNVGRTKDYFADYVFSRGQLPSIRIGNQPYGILPTTAFSEWEWRSTFNLGTDVKSSMQSDFIGGKFGLNDASYMYSDFFIGGSHNPFVGVPEAHKFYSDRFYSRLTNVLRALNRTWLDMVDVYAKAAHLDYGKSGLTVEDRQKDFLEMLGLDATTAEAAVRFLTNDLSFQNADFLYSMGTNVLDPKRIGGTFFDFVDSKWSRPNISGSSLTTKPTPDTSALFTKIFNGFDFIGSDWIQNINLGTTTGLFDHNLFPTQNGGLVFPGSTDKPDVSLYIERLLRSFRVLQHEKSYGLRGPSVDEKLLSENSFLSPTSSSSTRNYIQWLLDQKDLRNVWYDNRFDKMQSRSLLFLLLRQSLLLTYRNVACDVIVSNNYLSDFGLKSVGTPEGIARYFNSLGASGAGTVLSKWHLLFYGLDTLRNYSVNGVYPYRGALDFYSSMNCNNAFAGMSLPSQFSSLTSAGWWNKSLAEHMLNPVSGSPAFTDTIIREVRAAMDVLSGCSTAELDRLLKEHIDLCTYRLDAWNYGMVNKRLWENRNIPGSRVKGNYLGAYSWVIDVRPTGALSDVSNKIPKSLQDSSSSTYHNSANLGFIHTPSVAHALCAALLRSGYDSEKNTIDNKFAINLSSERVKIAMSLLEGVRNGQTLGAILGYRFEKGLHDRYSSTLELDEYIYKFRRKFPLTPETAITNPTSGGGESRLTNVVDGVELQRYFKSKISDLIQNNPSKSIWDLYTTNASLGSGNSFSDKYASVLVDIPGLPAYGTSSCDAIMAEVDRMFASADSLGDLIVAEGVFQIANGNTVKSASVVESMTEGKMPPELDIVNTPRTGINVTHRVVNIVDCIQNSSIASVWTGGVLTPRAYAEPNLNTWFGKILTVPFDSNVVTLSNFAEKIGCKVTYNDENDVPQEFNIKLLDLAIQPIDLLYMVQDGDYTSELADRIGYYTRVNASDYYATSAVGIPYNIPLTIHFKDKGSIVGVIASFSDIVSLVCNAADLVKSSKYLQAKDFVRSASPATGSSTTPKFDFTNLADRFVSTTNTNSIYKILNNLLLSLSGITAINNMSQLNSARNVLKKCLDFGVSGALPVYPSDDYTSEIGQETLSQVKRVEQELIKRKTDADQYSLTSVNDNVLLENYLAIGEKLFSNGFKVIPHFSFDYYTGLLNDLSVQLNNVGTKSSSDILSFVNDIDIEMDDWIYSVSRVRDKVETIETLRLLSSESLHNSLKVVPIQLPYDAGDCWAGIEYPNTFSPKQDKLSIVLFNKSQFVSTVPVPSPSPWYCGFIIDEWVETIPFKEETTAVTFNYDQPDAKAPQNCLLIVNPYPKNNATSYIWTPATLTNSLLDTLDMSVIRMVEPDHFKSKKTSDAIDAPLESGYTHTGVFDAFKYVLPAIVGEVTPHIIAGNDPYSHSSYTGKGSLSADDSTQQVSFEYIVNNVPGLSPGGYTPYSDTGNGSSVSNPPYSSAMLHWSELDSDTVISDNDLQEFMNAEIMNEEIMQLQNQLNNLSQF